jgi:hypothetical protein
MTTGGGPKPPVRQGTIPGVAPTPSPSKPGAPTPSPSKPAEGSSREEVRGVATAIARAEVATLRDALTARVVRIEARLAALEQKPVASPALAPIPAAPITAPLPVTPPPLPVTPPPITPPPLPVAPIPIAPALPPPPIASTPVIVDLSRISAADFDHPFANAARRRRRLAILFVCLLVAAVGSIVVTAIVSQALNDHSSRR